MANMKRSDFGYKQIGVADLLDILHSKCFQYDKDRLLSVRSDCRSELKGLIPSEMLSQWHMDSSDAFAVLSLSIRWLPIRIEIDDQKIPAFWCNSAKKVVLSTLRKIRLHCQVEHALSQCAAIGQVSCNSFVHEVPDYGRGRFGLATNTLLHGLPPGFVRRLLGWAYLKYQTPTTAIYVENADDAAYPKNEYEGVL